jgi:hypothetical protein
MTGCSIGPNSWLGAHYEPALLLLVGMAQPTRQEENPDHSGFSLIIDRYLFDGQRPQSEIFSIAAES